MFNLSANLNNLLSKKQYLKKSPLWKYYKKQCKGKLNINQKRDNSVSQQDKKLEYFSINSKLFSSVLINEFSQRYQDQKLIKSKKIEKEELQKFRRKAIQILSKQFMKNNLQNNYNYNILRGLAFFASQNTVQIENIIKNFKKNSSNQNQTENKNFLTENQFNYLTKLSQLSSLFFNSQNKNENSNQLNDYRYTSKTVQFLNQYQMQQINNTFDQLDDLIVSNLPNSQIKLLKLCNMKQFYWANQQKQNIKKLVNFVYNEILQKNWRNIETLELVLARLNSSQAIDMVQDDSKRKFELLKHLDDLISFEKKSFGKKKIFYLKQSKNFNRKISNIQSINNVQLVQIQNEQQYSALCWITIHCLNHLFIQIKFDNGFGQNILKIKQRQQQQQKKSLTKKEQQFLRVLKSINLQNKKDFLKILAIESILKKITNNEIKTQSRFNSKSKSNKYSYSQYSLQQQLLASSSNFYPKNKSSLNNFNIQTKSQFQYQLLNILQLYQQKIKIMYQNIGSMNIYQIIEISQIKQDLNHYFYSNFCISNNYILDKILSKTISQPQSIINLNNKDYKDKLLIFQFLCLINHQKDILKFFQKQLIFNEMMHDYQIFKSNLCVYRISQLLKYKKISQEKLFYFKIKNCSAISKQFLDILFKFYLKQNKNNCLLDLQKSLYINNIIQLKQVIQFIQEKKNVKGQYECIQKQKQLKQSLTLFFKQFFIQQYYQLINKNLLQKNQLKVQNLSDFYMWRSLIPKKKSNRFNKMNYPIE